jgi:uncharacterized protein
MTHDYFHPAFTNPHAQTLLGALWRDRQQRFDGLAFTRERIETPDDDFVDLDTIHVARVQLPPDAPRALLLHGLESSGRSGQICQLARELAACGVQAIALNFRGCSGELQRTRRWNHAGFTEDVRLVVDQLTRSEPISIVGISLGANVLLKYAGEESARLADRVRGIVAISPPLDLVKASVVMARPSQWLYTTNFLRTLRVKAAQHADKIKRDVDLLRIDAARTLYDFDDAFIAPLHGFRDGRDYYVQSSCVQHLHNMRVPTLILRALDDPFFDPSDVADGQARIANTAAADLITWDVTTHGGHCGFIEAGAGQAWRGWAERRAAAWVAAEAAR